MPRNGSGVFSLPAVYVATTGNTITAIQHNSPLTDIAADLNAARPVTCGGTGATTAADARDNLGLTIGTDVAAADRGVQTGTVHEFYGTVAPAGYIFPYGQDLSRTTYAALFAVFGTRFGEGDGSTTFGCVDRRGRTAFGKDDMGGTAADRLTNQTGGIDGATLGATGGSETHTLVEAELPSITPIFTGDALAAHGHPARYGPLSGSTTDTTGGIALQTGDSNKPAFTGTPDATAGHQIGGASAGTPSGTVSSFGSDEAHNNLPPGIVCNYILKT